MADSVHRKNLRPRETQGFRRGWCCPFGLPHKNVENLNFYHSKTPQKYANSFPNSPQTSKTALGLVGRIDPRRILSPGRVSPIDSDTPLDHRREIVTEISSVVDIGAKVGSVMTSLIQEDTKNEVFPGVYDVRLSLKGKNGGCLVLELNSEVLSANSSVFAKLISDCGRNLGSSKSICRIEVPEVENLSIFHETIELMFEEDIMKRFFKMGVSRSVDVLEVAAGIVFTKGVLSCLKYLEAVPWSESEEEKLKSLFRRISFDDTTATDVLARLYTPEQIDSQQHLAMQLVRSVTNGTDAHSKSELKSLVKGLLSKSSTYEKDLAGLNKSEIYDVCQSCLGSLVELFEEASDSKPEERLTREESSSKPLIVRISRQVDNIIWLLEILLDQQMAEEFVDVWADQGDLRRMHERVSQMVRYELSRISVWVFIALGTGKMQCRSEARCGVLQGWFVPLLVDFGWLQRCRKGLDIKVLEEATGQALLTLPMKNQQILFMEWIQFFSKQGTTECPNLSKAFQIWWRRSFLKGCEARAVDSR